MLLAGLSIHIFPTLDKVSADTAGFAPFGRRNHSDKESCMLHNVCVGGAT
jgi:hypothetical protein